jgi:archaellum biogenesis ATPase FlaH
MSRQRQNTDELREVMIMPMSAYKPETIEWLEEGRIALGKLTLLAGDPGLGKSFVTLDLAARVSRMGKQALILSAEDDPNDTIRPRLDALGADINNVHLLAGITSLEDKPWQPPELDVDAALLTKRISLMGRSRDAPYALIVIDPISAYMGRTDSHNNAEVRGVLAELARMAQVTGAAVVCVTHLNKDSGNKKAVYRAMGSLAFTAAARTVHLVTKHRDDPSKRVVSVVKNNLGGDSGSRVYRIVDGKVEWLDEIYDFDPDADFVGADSDAPGAAITRAEQFLLDMLGSRDRSREEIHAEASHRGIGERTLRRAKEALGVRSYQRNGQWMWSKSDENAPDALRSAHGATLHSDICDLGDDSGFLPMRHDHPDRM